MTKTSLRALLRRAARLLDDEAKIARESCTAIATGALWGCDDCDRRTCRAKKLHDRHVATAKELRDAAVKGLRG